MEVNASPSLTASSKEDYDLKYGMLEDVLNVIDLENRYCNNKGAFFINCVGGGLQ